MTQGETTGHTTESQPTAPLPSSPAIQTSYDNIFRSIPELQEAHDALATYAESLGLGRPGPNQYSALIAASQKHPELCQHLLHIFYLLHVYQLIEGPTERINHKSITMQLPKGQSAKVVGLSMPSSQLQLEMAQVRAKRAAGLSDPPKEINAPTFWAQIWHIVKKGLK
ncbi:hypothetical protein BSLG_010468 [Batrachochytrium salamandrivorans]|nr:hypothetical protein BSLG_010468 [Batrachochytrium salamandrivorans]